MFILPIVIFVVFVVIAVIIITISKNAHSGLKNLIDSEGLKSLKDIAGKLGDSVQEITTTTCEYCGSKCEKSEDKCPNCGATVRNKKD